MKKWKVLNLYAGIGGNRKLWENVEVDAIENNKSIAKIYKDFFPKDNVIVDDAHKYLLKHYNDGYDFIWTSPPCTTHTSLKKIQILSNDYRTGNYKKKALYPDMSLYQEIILLEHFFQGKWIVENVVGYYKPLLRPQLLQRHYIWSNFLILSIDLDADNIKEGTINEWEKILDFDLSCYSKIDKRKILRNCVRPKLGKHILDCARRIVQTKLN